MTGPGSRCKSSDVSCLLKVEDGATRSRGGVEMNHFSILGQGCQSFTPVGSRKRSYLDSLNVNSYFVTLFL